MKKLQKKIGFYFMRMIRAKKIREFFVQKAIKKIPKIDLPKNNGKSVSINKNELTEKGYTELGLFLSSDEIDNILQKMASFKCFDPFRKELGEFRSNEIPKQVHVANYKRKDISVVKELLDIANNSDILIAVRDFLGATPTITNINMWWSIPGKEQAEQAQLFHRDVDDYKFCKLFVYLTDVEMEDGPHVYVEGSSSSPKLRKIKRYSDKEIIEVFGEKAIKHFIRPKGSAFLVDTYGFHKGLLPEQNKRLLFQVQYSLNPIGIENYEPIAFETHNYNKYVNRLILKK